MLIIGSVALNRINPNRVPKDLDIICYRAEIPLLETLFNTVHRNDKSEFKTFLFTQDKRQIELLIIDHLPGFQYLDNEIGSSLRYANATTLLDIKRSHIFRPRNFEKHIADYHWLRNYLIDSGFEPVFHTYLDKDQETINGGKLRTPSLMKSKDDFFDDKVVKVFEHDDIHKVMAHKEQPMYTFMQKEGTDVFCSKSLWDKFSHEDKIMTVLEEAYVIALERKVIPHIFLGEKHWTDEESFKWALMRICTTLCKGWFRQFAVDNYFEILNKHNLDYSNIFLSAYENGEIKEL
jgi:hypothetical protein